MNTLRLCLTWLRRTFSLSTSAQSWGERLALAGVLAAALALALFGGGLPGTALFALWWAWLLAAALLLRGSWLKLFGPVLWYDLIRAARRSRFLWLRCAYACLLLFLLYTTFANRPHYGSEMDVRHAGAQMAANYFELFMVVQFVAVLLLTPAYVAGAVAEEKDRKTMDYLLATDLRNHEIVLGKLASRLANLTLVLLTGLPILSLLQFLGGIDPDLVLAGFAATAVTMLSLGSLSMLVSVVCKKPRNAIGMTYLALLAYFLISVLAIVLQFVRPDLMALGVGDITVKQLVDAINSGNIFFVLAAVKFAGGRGTLAQDLPGLLRGYVLFHGVAAAAACVTAVLRVRTVALRQASAPAKQSRFVGERARVAGDPMMWKETVIEGGLRLSWAGWLLMLVLVALTFWPAVEILRHHLARGDAGLRRRRLPGPGDERLGAPGRHGGVLRDAGGGGGTGGGRHQRRARTADIRRPAGQPAERRRNSVRQVAGQHSERAPGLGVAAGHLGRGRGDGRPATAGGPIPGRSLVRVRRVSGRHGPVVFADLPHDDAGGHGHAGHGPGGQLRPLVAVDALHVRPARRPRSGGYHLGAGRGDAAGGAGRVCLHRRGFRPR